MQSQWNGRPWKQTEKVQKGNYLSHKVSFKQDMFIEIQNSVCGRDNEFGIQQAAFMFSANESFFYITFFFPQNWI